VVIEPVTGLKVVIDCFFNCLLLRNLYPYAFEKTRFVNLIIFVFIERSIWSVVEIDFFFHWLLALLVAYLLLVSITHIFGHSGGVSTMLYSGSQQGHFA
jgi:hypothetical protein